MKYISLYILSIIYNQILCEDILAFMVDIVTNVLLNCQYRKAEIVHLRNYYHFQLREYKKPLKIKWLRASQNPNVRII